MHGNGLRFEDGTNTSDLITGWKLFFVWFFLKTVAQRIIILYYIILLGLCSYTSDNCLLFASSLESFMIRLVLFSHSNWLTSSDSIIGDYSFNNHTGEDFDHHLLHHSTPLSHRHHQQQQQFGDETLRKMRMKHSEEMEDMEILASCAERKVG